MKLFGRRLPHKPTYGGTIVELLQQGGARVGSGGTEYDEYCDGGGRYWLACRGESRLRRHDACWCPKAKAPTQQA